MSEGENTIEVEEPPKISDRQMSKIYSVVQGIWDERDLLPATLSENNMELGKPLKIPLVGGAFIELGTSGIKDKGQETVYLEVYKPKTKNEYVLTKFGTNITSVYLDHPGYDFWVFYDNENDPGEIKIMKFLANFAPIKDIDWDNIRPQSSEMEIALSICTSVFEAQQRSRGKNHKSTGI